MLTAILATQPASAADVVDAQPRPGQSAVFVMSNDPQENEVWAYERTAEGTLTSPRTYRTGGRGSGGNVDPLASQGSLRLSQDRNWLFAVNAGSGTLSVFRVAGARLELVNRVPTGGSEPNAIAQSGNLVYVLNTAGSSSVVGFYFHNGELEPIQDSLRFLSANGIGSASIVFSPDRKTLLVTERTSNKIDVFGVEANGQLSKLTSTEGVGPGTFAASFAPQGFVIVC
jgi:6-phosphogluconolactonase (cycloisomerase 2 family)